MSLTAFSYKLKLKQLIKLVAAKMEGKTIQDLHDLYWNFKCVWCLQCHTKGKLNSLYRNASLILKRYKIKKNVSRTTVTELNWVTR